MTDFKLAPIILDASCLINLYASGRLKEITESLPEPLIVSEYVLKQEALFILRKESEKEEQKIPVDISALISTGLIEVVSIKTDAEVETFIDLASELGDGEAISVSLAIHRGYCVATDDRKALRVISERTSISSVSTLGLIKQWAESTNASKTDIKSVLSFIWTGASYYPGERDPLYSWWREMMSP